MDLYTIIGLGGVGFYVGAYALVQFGKMDGNGASFSVMNVIAASMVLVSLFEDFNLPSLVTQVTWIGVGLIGLALRATERRSNETQDARADVAGSADGASRAGRKAVVAEQPSSTPSLALALAGGGTRRPPIHPSAEGDSNGRQAGKFVRVQPIAAPVKSTPQTNFGLQPADEPTLVASAPRAAATIGLQPDAVVPVASAPRVAATIGLQPDAVVAVASTPRVAATIGLQPDAVVAVASTPSISATLGLRPDAAPVEAGAATG